MLSDTFTKRLRAYRKLKNMTQRDLADALGVSVAIVGALERGTRIPNEMQLQQIARVLQVSRGELGVDIVSDPLDHKEGDIR